MTYTFKVYNIDTDYHIYRLTQICHAGSPGWVASVDPGSRRCCDSVWCSGIVHAPLARQVTGRATGNPAIGRRPGARLGNAPRQRHRVSPGAVRQAVRVGDAAVADGKPCGHHANDGVGRAVVVVVVDLAEPGRDGVLHLASMRVHLVTLPVPINNMDYQI